MSSLSTTTTQYPNNPTKQDYIHTPKIKTISSHEIEIDMSHFYISEEKNHYIETITLYSLRRIVDTVHFNKENKVYKVIFDLDKINKTDRDLSEINEWTPRNWKVTDKYHAIVKCNIHGNWSDVPKNYI